MTNTEKLTEVFGNFLQDLNNLDDFRKWLKQEYKQPDISEVTYIEGKDGQLSFLRDKELYHFEGWASWNNNDGYPCAYSFNLYTQAKSEAQAINCIKAQIKKLYGLPMNRRVDISLNDGVSTLTKELKPISEYRLVYPNGSGVEILVKARNIKEVCAKLDKCGIPTAVFDADIRIGGIANEEDDT